MNDIKIFEKTEFGQIRTVEIDGQPYFVAADIAKALGYKDATNAIKQHCRWVVKHHIPHPQSPEKTIRVNIIPEGDVYRLITGSELPSAEDFEIWVYDDVLPSLRKTGSYEMPGKEKKLDKPKKESRASVNMTAKIVESVFSKAGVSNMYIAAEVKRIYSEAGYDIKIPLITDKETMSKLYDCTEMAKELGIYSSKDKPHNQAVGAIIKQLDIPASEIVTTAFSRNGHEDVTIQYKPSVVEEVRLWLAKNNYPNKIPYTDSKGNPKTCTVAYKEVP